MRFARFQAALLYSTSRRVCSFAAHAVGKQPQSRKTKNSTVLKRKGSLKT